MPAAPANQGPINFGAINVQPQGQPFQATPKPTPLGTPSLLQAPQGQPSGLLTPDVQNRIVAGVQKMQQAGYDNATIQNVVNAAKVKFAASPTMMPSVNAANPASPTPLQIAGAKQSAGNALSQIIQQFQGGATQAASSLKDLITGNQPAINPQNLQTAYQGGGLPAALAEGGAQSLKAGEQGVAQLGSAVGGIGAAVTAPLAPLFNAGTKIGQNIGNAVPTPIAKGIATASSNPTVNENVQDIMNLSNLAVPEAADKGIPIARDVNTKVGEAAQATKEAVTSTPEAKSAKVVSTLTKDWERPTTINTPAFNKARAALEQSPGTPKFLAQEGIDPYSLVEDGKYSTTETADSLRNTAGKMSSDALRPSLQEADYSTPRTPVSEIQSAAVKRANTERFETAGGKEAAVKSINKEAAALQRKYPNGMSLTDMHDEKIVYAKNGGYSPIKSPADNSIATGNRSLSSAMGKLVETKAPKDVPVNDFNKYLSQYYKAADYLDTLNTKKAPVPLGKTIARGVAKYGGAAIGEHLGGGIVSAFAGYSIGRAIEHALENLPNPAREAFIRNLQKTNPEAFAQVQKYIGDEAVARATRLALPPGKPQGSPENPIQLGRGIDTSGAKMLPAQKTLPTANPKTGRMQKTYSSQPQNPLPLDSSQAVAKIPPTSSKTNNMPTKIGQKTKKVK